MTDKLDWYGCYNQSWKGLITDDSFAHPAKFSRGLIERIYRYLLDEAWLVPGNTVLDPFGGVALGAFPALRAGLNWVGVELEQHFTDLGMGNIALWESRYRGKLPRWGQATLLNGNSRYLDRVLDDAHQGSVDAVVASPPFSRSEAIVSAQKLRDPSLKWRANQTNPKSHSVSLEAQLSSLEKANTQVYAAHPANLGKLPFGRFDAVISSPPFAGNTGGKGEASRNKIDPALFDRHLGGIVGGMGESQGNVGRLAIRDADFTAALQGDEKETFWTAARAIVAQSWQALKPGGVAAWVVKDFSRNRQIVPLSDMWEQLCQSVGFTTLAVVRAWLINPAPVQRAFFGGDVDFTTSRKTFWRRVYEKNNPHLRIDWETVVIVQKV
jgi:tRNA G10  N-methylase Trm11